MTFPEAERRLREVQPSTGTDWAALSDACGAVAAETIRAPEDLPRLPRSAMDGYALRAADRADGPLRCVGSRYAGDAPGDPLAPGECIAVATGAALPAGADAVVPRESTRADGPWVRILRPPNPGDNLAVPGEEGRSGALLLAAGERIGPRHIAALAAYGYDRVAVHERLRVAVVATGDEVVEPGARARPEQVYESSAPALEAELRALGIRVDRFAPCPDAEGDLAARFGALLTTGNHHAVLTTGGVSAGDRDLVPAVWERLGAQRLFWRVGVKPGRAIYVARAGSTWVFSLSGNPHAALASYYSLIRPALWALAGGTRRDRYSGRLAEACEARRDAYRLLWAEAGPAHGTLRPLTGLPMLETMIRASALLLIPPGDAPLSEGATVDAVVLDAPGGGLA